MKRQLKATSGSGCYATKGFTLKFNFEAKRLAIGLTPNLSVVSQDTLWIRAHSVSVFVFLDAFETRTLNFPGIWAVDSYIQLSMHQSHTGQAKSLLDAVSPVPMCASVVTAVVLSIITLTCFAFEVCLKSFQVKENN